LGDKGAKIRSLMQRDAISPLARHALGLGVLVLTIVPAYAYFGAPADGSQPDSEIVQMAREAVEASETSLEIAEILEIEAHIREVAVRYDIPPILVAAIVEAESEFNPRAVSRRGARGLMQLMPGTASSLKVTDTFDPYENIEGGVRHLRRLMDRYRGNLPLVLAAYNAGEQAVLVYGGVPPYRETRRYVSRILRRIGRADLVPQYGAGRNRVSAINADVIPVSATNVNVTNVNGMTTSRLEPSFTYVVTDQPRSGWAERLALERHVPPTRIDHGPVARPTDSAIQPVRPARPNGQGP
jgi:Transglycosylase SLT domain